MTLRGFFIFLCLVLPLFAAAADCTTLYAKFTEQRPEGPRVWIHAKLGPETKNFEKIQDLTLLEQNVESLYSYRGKLDRPPLEKAESKIKKLAENINNANPDIAMFAEVEGYEAAVRFVQQRLGQKYKVILIDGNDPRNVQMALIVKRDLPLDILVQSHRNLETDGGRKIFTRDLMVARFFPPGTKEPEQPLFTIMFTHNKSQRNSYKDERSIGTRAAQTAMQVEIAKKEIAEHPKTPIFLMGDLNSDVRFARELQDLWQFGFKDSFDLSPQKMPREKRATHVFFPKEGEAVHSQLDAILASPEAQRLQIVKEAEVVHGVDDNGQPRSLPQTLEEKRKQESDHRGIRVVVDFAAIRDAWRK
jgi:hypothetical protein